MMTATLLPGWLTDTQQKMVDQKRIIREIRTDLDLPESATDEYIVRLLENSYLWAFAHLRLAVSDLKESIKKAFNCNKYL